MTPPTLTTLVILLGTSVAFAHGISSSRGSTSGDLAAPHRDKLLQSFH